MDLILGVITIFSFIIFVISIYVTVQYRKYNSCNPTDKMEAFTVSIILAVLTVLLLIFWLQSLYRF